jgi:transforming growth factor-beta-induced protein
MKTAKIISLVTLCVGLIGQDAHAQDKDIVDTAVGSGSFNTLTAAVKAAGLVDALKSEGPYTVFAPTDEAFAKLPEGTVENLLKPENKEQLIDILTYHVIKGNVPASVATNLKQATALNDKVIAVKLTGDGLFLNQSRVVKTDITATNGVIHVIDQVLLPPAAAGESMGFKDSRELIQAAIAIGAPMYNHGNTKGCAAVYQLAARALLSMPDTRVTESQKKCIQAALMKVKNSHSNSDNAWTLRDVFDGMMPADN